MNFLANFIFVAFTMLMLRDVRINCQTANGSNYHEALLKKLFSNYNKQLKRLGQINVSIEVSLVQIVSVSEKDQMIILSTWIAQEWNDDRLRWNPSDYNDIDYLPVSSDKIWIPDSMFLLSADSDVFIKSDPNVLVGIYPNGAIYFSKMLNNLKSRCQMDIRWFPFDTQKCSIQIGTPTFNTRDINYVSAGDRSFYKDGYIENKVWDAVQLSSKFVEKFYGADVGYSEIHLELSIKRKPLFVISNLVIPALLLTIATLISFWIPFAQALPIGMSVMLAFSVLAIRLNDNLPVSSDSLPMLTVYFITCMIFTIMGIIWFTIVNIMKETKEIPLVVQYFIVYCLTYCFCVSKTRKTIRKSFKLRNNTNGSDNQLLCCEKLFVTLLSILNRFMFTVFFFFLFILNILVLAILPQ